MRFNVNTDAVVKHTAKLERLSRSAMPNAVRGTLNALAFDVKKKTMPLMAQKEFTVRKKNFFKANSRVNLAKGFDLDRMKSSVGFIYMKGSGNNKAVEELEQQEHGGKIKNRKLIPLQKARISKSRNKMVAARNRLRGIKIVKTRNTEGNNEKHKFFNAVMKAGPNGYVETEKSLIRVKSIRRIKNRFKFNLETIYLVNNRGYVDIDKTGFMKKATKMSYKNADKIFFKEADRQFERHFR